MTEAKAIDDTRLTGIDYELVVHPEVGSLEEAAQLRGVPASAVIKTMVVRRGDDDYVFVLVPGDRVIDWPKLRTFLGVRRLSMPDADDALLVTGYRRGTITPFASARELPVIADERIVSGVVSIGAGAPGNSLTMDGADVVHVLDAQVVDVTRASG